MRAKVVKDIINKLDDDAEVAFELITTVDVHIISDNLNAGLSDIDMVRIVEAIDMRGIQDIDEMIAYYIGLLEKGELDDE